MVRGESHGFWVEIVAFIYGEWGFLGGKGWVVVGKMGFLGGKSRENVWKAGVSGWECVFKLVKYWVSDRKWYLIGVDTCFGRPLILVSRQRG